MSEDFSPGAAGGGQPPANKMPVWAWILIGCGGVGALFVLLAIVAAIAIPSLIAARRNSFEVAGACNLRSYATAQVMYAKMSGGRGYAHPFTNLYMDASSGNKTLMLIDRGFNDAAGPGGMPKQGYRFQDCKTIGEKPIDWTKEYALCASPAFYGRTGRLTLVVGTDGLVWGKDLGPNGTFVDDFPADPKAAGWSEAD